jgi:hypothetical protein
MSARSLREVAGLPWIDSFSNPANDAEERLPRLKQVSRFLGYACMSERRKRVVLLKNSDKHKYI